MRVVIYGAGGHSREVADILLESGHEVVGFVDDRLRGQHFPTGIPVVPNDRAPAAEGFVVAIGDSRVRADKFESLIGATIPVDVISSSAQVSRWATLGSGVQIAQNAVVNAGAAVGDDVILNVSCVVSHDVSVGAHTHVAPGALLGGGSTVGLRCLVGAGAIVLPAVKIGDDCVIGAGAVVTKDVCSGCTVAGVPARQHWASQG